MELLLSLIEQYGLWLVFAAVLVEQLGVPIPAYPTLIVTGALAARGDYTPADVVLTAVLACLLADMLWYFAGSRIGRRVLRVMCRISLSPDSCVRQTESIYERWGAPSLMVAKFIPGFAAVATAMAGVVRTPIRAFLFFDAIGAALWASVAVVIGWIFRNAVKDVLTVLNEAGRIGLMAIVAAFILFALWKALQRHRFMRQLRMSRVSVSELNDMLKTETRPLIVDVRSTVGRQGGAIPGAIWIDTHAVDASLEGLPSADEVIVYCACPNEASAAAVAKRLMKHGFARVRPLSGGIDAWVAAGYQLEEPLRAVEETPVLA